MIPNYEDRLYDRFDQIRVLKKPPIKAPDANIYQVEGGKIQEDFSILNGPDIPDPSLAPIKFATTMIPGAPGYEEWAERQKAIQKIAPPRPPETAEIVEKNFLDKFFDWLNEMLRGIF